MQLPAFLGVAAGNPDCGGCFACTICIGTPTPDVEFFVALMLTGL
jgi:hypothetical protein